MKTLKIKLYTIIALAIVAVITLGTWLGLTVAKADRSVTVTGSSVFYTSGSAEVWAHRTDDEKYYTMFVLKNGGDSVNFRKNLAYSWIYDAATKTEDDEETPVLTPEKGSFNMEVGFELTDGKVGFEKFIMTFESQEYSQTKDGKAVNYIIFYANETGTALSVVISTDKNEEPATNAPQINPDHIEIKFTPDVNGVYRVNVGGATGTFENVYGTYARYSSSTTTPVTPISFSAEFAEGVDASANMALYNLNGQSFELKGTREEAGHYVGGTVNDDTPPVLCLDKGVTYIELGEEISFNYTVIDVLTSSPSLETSYFMLTEAQAANSEFNAEDYTNDKLFRAVTDSDDQKMIPHVTHYLPKNTDYNASVFDKNLEVKAAVKVLLKLTDTTSTGGQSCYVMLDWYVSENNLVTINEQKYIAVATDTLGATFNYGDKWNNLIEAYQAEVDKAAEDLMAGSKNYFYLPSVKDLLSDNATAYEDLTFAVYYNNGSQQQESNKASNTLNIPLNKAGKYVFTIYATDRSGNPMYYINKDGEPEEFEASDIWHMYGNEDEYEGMKDYLPWFEFTVGASEISIEDPEEQSTAYVGSSYTPDAFDINGVSYTAKYNLYLFNSELYYSDHKDEAMTYDEFMALKDSFFTDQKDSMRKYFTYIYASSELTEGTEEYELYNDYGWNNSSPRFTPQDANSFYLIECKVTSNDGGTQEATAYMGIACAPKVANLKGEDTWVSDNMTSIILLSIAGVSLVGIVLLLVIKPKNKDVDEVE